MLNLPVYKRPPRTGTKFVRLYPYVSTGKERDSETGYGYFARQARGAYHGARYMDHELMTMWLSVDPMSDKYPNVYPDTFRHMSGHWNVYREGKKLDELPNYTRLNSLVRVVKMKEAFVYRLLIP